MVTAFNYQLDSEHKQAQPDVRKLVLGPDKIRYKKACINVLNNDNMCFKWAILSALHLASHSWRVSEYRRYEGKLNFAGIEFPLTPN